MEFIARFFFLLTIAVVLGTGCGEKPTTPAEPEPQVSFYPTSKPSTRWWWFATEIKKPDVRHQLDWAKEHNFGGVEIAWVYPLYRYDKMYARSYGRHYPKDSSAQKWLSPEWTEVVTYAKQYADSIGLACDFTFGSAWPAAGSNIGTEHTTKVYGDTAFRQTLTFSWAYPEIQLVINHLDSNAFNHFAEPIARALAPALKGSKSALFTDSWEIKLNDDLKIWTDGFDSTFQAAFGYDLVPYMDQGIDSFPDVRYDYMMHLGDYVMDGFYKPYVRQCREMGAWSRVQCLAAPTDVMSAYALVDIPETECMLNNPNYSRIVSSAACLASKPMVSSETFTCMYGFPHTYLHKEQTADLKMTIDAMFAVGANQHIYHGMPFNPKGSDTITFFATTYFGPGGSLTEELPDFNAYVGKVSGLMQKGKTYSDVAVYVPYEDGVMKGGYPQERRRVWVWGEYEMRYIWFPEELEGYHPLWINRDFLTRGEWKDGKFRVGDAAFSSLYIDVNYMDVRALRRVLQLAEEGLPICLKRRPMEPGKVKSGEFAGLLDKLEGLENVSSDVNAVVQHAPMIAGDSLPDYWCREEADGTKYLFIAQPKAKDLAYPVYCGQSFMDGPVTRNVTLNVNGKSRTETLVFEPYQSIMLKFSPDGEMEYVDIGFVPKDPDVRPREKQRMYF
ncbi:MAG: glycosyl hydrolase [Bacteroidota bacterium]